jgi:hypothetical protein
MSVALVQWQWGGRLGPMRFEYDFSARFRRHGVTFQETNRISVFEFKVWEQLQKARGPRTTLVSLSFTCVLVFKSCRRVLLALKISVHCTSAGELLKLQGEINCVTNSFTIHYESNSSIIENLSVTFKLVARITLHVYFINATWHNDKQPSHTAVLTPQVKCLYPRAAESE